MIYAPKDMFAVDRFYVSSEFFGPLYAKTATNIITKIRETGGKTELIFRGDVYAIRIWPDGLEVRICG